MYAAQKRQNESDWEDMKKSSLHAAKIAKTAVWGGSVATFGGKSFEEVAVSQVLSEKVRRQSEVFTPPEWCALPSPGVHIEVTRASRTTGQMQVAARFMIDQHRFYIFGTNKELCDINLEHESCSRVHLAVVHHRDGGVYVIDLASTHGTFLSGTRLAPRQLVAWPESEKLRTGSSSRSYVLRCRAPPKKLEGVDYDDIAKFVAECAQEEAQEVRPYVSLAPPRVEAPPVVAEEAPPPVAEEETPVTASHILIKHVNSAKPEWKGVAVTRTHVEALKLAEGLRHTILGDADNFGAYAKKYSECASGKKKGGEMPPMRLSEAGEVFQPIFDALRGMTAGAISLVVETDLGLHILKRC